MKLKDLIRTTWANLQMFKVQTKVRKLFFYVQLDQFYKHLLTPLTTERLTDYFKSKLSRLTQKLKELKQT